MPLAPGLAALPYGYLTTTGSVSGRPREIEIWFAAGPAAVYLISGGADRSAWVRNLLADPAATLRVGDRVLGVRARLPLPPGDERDDAIARLRAKYGGQLSSSVEEWRASAYMVALDPA